MFWIARHLTICNILKEDGFTYCPITQKSVREKGTICIRKWYVNAVDKYAGREAGDCSRDDNEQYERQIKGLGSLKTKSFL